MRILRKSIWLLSLVVVLVSSLSPCSLLYAQEEKVDLSLRMLSGYYYKEVAPGESTTLFIEVRNNGNTAITDINLTADTPEDWLVKIVPGSITKLGAGSSQTVDISVTPGKNSSNGEYTVTLIADATETKTVVSTTLRVKSDSSFWLWIGIGMAALVAVGFVIIFRRFGKQ